MSMSQRQAVYKAVSSVYTIESGTPVTLTDAMHESVIDIICEGFKAGEIEFKDTPSNKEKLAVPSKLRSYVIGLINNWLRKDPMLNGGGKYVAKNPGSRAGSGDEQLKTLKALAVRFATDATKLSVINMQIEARRTELASAKSKAVELTQEQIDALPDSVREALGF